MIHDTLDAIPRGHYATIYADPAWHHITRSAKGMTSRHPSRHYPTMSLDAIRAMPVREMAARDCHLFLWTTGPHLEQAFSVLKAWGFRYSSDAFVWVKLNPKASDLMFLGEADLAFGPGHTTRKNAEYVLLGRKGSPPRLNKAVRQIIISPRRQHSRKPDEVARRIITYAPGPRLELFARNERGGFDAWGDEVGKFEAVA